MKTRRSRDTLARVALVTTALAVVLLGSATSASASSSETASVISVHSDGTVVPLPADSYTNVASLLLPAGTWLLVAKADFVNTDDASHSIKCRLVAGGQADVTATGLDQEIGGAFRRTLFSVLPRHVSSVNGMLARWRCRAWEGQDGSVEARYIRLTAIGTGALKSINLDTNVVTSEGAGTPRMVSAFMDGPIDAPQSGSPAVVASFHLPQGAWWVTAKATARGADEFERNLSCDLTPSTDHRTVVLDTPASLLSVQSISLQSAFHAKKTGAPVRLTCESTATDRVRCRSTRSASQPSMPAALVPLRRPTLRRLRVRSSRSTALTDRSLSRVARVRSRRASGSASPRRQSETVATSSGLASATLMWSRSFR